MFYSQFVLAKKSPLGKVWLAAHWDRKLTKNQIFLTDIKQSVDSIISPTVPIALRTSGHLLLGVVRIYNRKTKYLLNDCSDALTKIKMAFRTGVVDLAPENATAAAHTITLADNMIDLDAVLPDLDLMDIDDRFGDDNALTTSTTNHSFNTSSHRSKNLNRSDQFDTSIDVLREQPTGLVDDFRPDNDFGPDDGPKLTDNSLGFNPYDDLELNNNNNNNDSILPQDRPVEDDFGGPDIGGGFDPVDITLNDRSAMEVDEINLAPLDTSRTKHASKKKRKIVMDVATELSTEQMKGQLKDSSNTLRPVRTGPPTKKQILMVPTEAVTLEFLYSHPSSTFFPKKFAALFGQNAVLTVLAVPTQAQQDDFVVEEPMADDFGATFEVGGFDDNVVPVDDTTVLNASTSSTLSKKERKAAAAAAAASTREHSDDQADIFALTQPGNDSSTAVEDDGPLDAGAGWSRRTQRMVVTLKSAFGAPASKKRSSKPPAVKEVKFSTLNSSSNRRTAAGALFEILVLKTKDYIQLEQSEPYADIILTAKEKLFQ